MGYEAKKLLQRELDRDLKITEVFDTLKDRLAKALELSVENHNLADLQNRLNSGQDTIY